MLALRNAVWAGTTRPMVLVAFGEDYFKELWNW